MLRSLRYSRWRVPAGESATPLFQPMLLGVGWGVSHGKELGGHGTLSTDMDSSPTMSWALGLSADLEDCLSRISAATWGELMTYTSCVSNRR